MNDPNAPRVHVRRRRSTRRHRRNRLLRRMLLATVFVLGGIAGAALLPFDFSSYLRSSLILHPPAQWKSADVRRDLALAATLDTDSRELPAKPISLLSIR